MSRDESRRSKRARADRDFGIPNSDMIMNDYDDERTLDEEEALEAQEDTHNELCDLQKESDMPLKDLLVMYGYGDMSCEDPNKAEDEEDDEEEEEEEEEDEEDEDDDDPATYEPDLKQFYTEMVKAEENGATNTRPSIAKGDPARNEEAAAHVASINAHVTPGPIEPKSEDPATTTTNIPDSLSTGPAEISSSGDNVNSTSSIPPGSGGGGGGGGGNSSRLLRSVSRPQSEEEEDDCDYSPDEEEWKKTIMVGSDYQATIPDGLCKYDDALPYENEDKMLWDPLLISEEKVEEFLCRAQVPAVKGSALPGGIHVRDDEQTLYLLLQCGYNLDEALRRRRMNVVPSSESVSLWSEEECCNFESGLRIYGKDFHLIQKHKVRTRSVGELVQFYYLWKKTERHDIFTCKARLEKKKYALHPGVTDYMDRFLDEQEGVRDRSSSPNVHSILYGDSKRQRTTNNSTSIDDQQQQNQAIQQQLSAGNNNKPTDNCDGPTSTSGGTVSSTTATPAATSDVSAEQPSSDHVHQNSSPGAQLASSEQSAWSASSVTPSAQPQQPKQQHSSADEEVAAVTAAAAENSLPAHLPP